MAMHDDPQMRAQGGPHPVQETDEALAESLAQSAEESQAAALGHEIELERNTRIARACNAAVEQLRMQDPPAEIDFSPRTTQGQLADSVVAAGGGPRP